MLRRKRKRACASRPQAKDIDGQVHDGFEEESPEQVPCQFQDAGGNLPHHLDELHESALGPPREQHPHESENGDGSCDTADHSQDRLGLHNLFPSAGCRASTPRVRRRTLGSSQGSTEPPEN